MSDTPRKRDQSKNKGGVTATFQDRFDRQAADIVQELALNGESFNRISYVRERIAAALRAGAKAADGMVLVPKIPTDEMVNIAHKAALGMRPTAPNRWENVTRVIIEKAIEASHADQA